MDRKENINDATVNETNNTNTIINNVDYIKNTQTNQNVGIDNTNGNPAPPNIGHNTGNQAPHNMGNQILSNTANMSDSQTAFIMAWLTDVINCMHSNSPTSTDLTHPYSPTAMYYADSSVLPTIDPAEAIRPSMGTASLGPWMSAAHPLMASKPFTAEIYQMIEMRKKSKGNDASLPTDDTKEREEKRARQLRDARRVLEGVAGSPLLNSCLTPELFVLMANTPIAVECEVDSLLLKGLAMRETRLSSRESAIKNVIALLECAMKSCDIKLKRKYYTYGSVDLLTCLPDGDYDLTVLFFNDRDEIVELTEKDMRVCPAQGGNLSSTSIKGNPAIKALLKQIISEATLLDAKIKNFLSSSPDPTIIEAVQLQLKTSLNQFTGSRPLLIPDGSTTFPNDRIHIDSIVESAIVPVLKLYTNGHCVDLSFNQTGGPMTVAFLFYIDSMIGQSHLFRRTILLLKAWARYESRIIGAQNGFLGTYTLTVMLIAVLNMLPEDVVRNGFDIGEDQCKCRLPLTPLKLLLLFLEYYSNFNFEEYCVTIYGAKHISIIQYKENTDKQVKCYTCDSDASKKRNAIPYNLTNNNYYNYSYNSNKGIDFKLLGLWHEGAEYPYDEEKSTIYRGGFLKPEHLKKWVAEYYKENLAPLTPHEFEDYYSPCNGSPEFKVNYFQVRIMNVQDPIRPYSNMTRGIMRGQLARLITCFRRGAEHLRSLLAYSRPAYSISGHHDDTLFTKPVPDFDPYTSPKPRQLIASALNELGNNQSGSSDPMRQVTSFPLTVSLNDMVTEMFPHAIQVAISQSRSELLMPSHRVATKLPVTNNAPTCCRLPTGLCADFRDASKGKPLLTEPFAFKYQEAELAKSFVQKKDKSRLIRQITLRQFRQLYLLVHDWEFLDGIFKSLEGKIENAHPDTKLSQLIEIPPDQPAEGPNDNANPSVAEPNSNQVNLADPANSGAKINSGTTQPHGFEKNETKIQLNKAMEGMPQPEPPSFHKSPSKGMMPMIHGQSLFQPYPMQHGHNVSSGRGGGGPWVHRPEGQMVPPPQATDGYERHLEAGNEGGGRGKGRPDKRHDRGGKGGKGKPHQ